MSWNYRVIKSVHSWSDYTEETYAIHEVYYRADGSIRGWTDEPARPTADTLEDLKSVLEMFKVAFDKPVLNKDELINGRR